MKILLATYWGVPGNGDCHTYIDLLKNGFTARGHQVDVLSHDPFWQNVYVNSDLNHSISIMKIRDVLAREILVYHDVHYKEIENWIVWQDIARYTFELAAAYLVDVKEYDVIHTQDIFSTRIFSRIMPASKPLISTIHGLYFEAAMKMGHIMGEDTPRWKYHRMWEHYGATSADLTIVPQWLKEEYSQKFGVPEKQMVTDPYVLNESVVNETLSIYHRFIDMEGMKDGGNGK
jgi:glycosyltransferase involved in cell wall biosynthesis